MLPNDNEVRGNLDKAAGFVKEKIGQANADPLLEEEGADQRAGGELEAGFGKAKRKIGEAVKDLGDKINR
jgi:uncharacterized protein YjbJ (UPF0337 family)